MRPTRDERQAVERRHDDQQRSVADHERSVLQDPADDRAEEVRAEGDPRRAHVAEPIGEDEVRDEDRSEAERDRGGEPRDEVEVRGATREAPPTRATTEANNGT